MSNATTDKTESATDNPRSRPKTAAKRSQTASTPLPKVRLTVRWSRPARQSLATLSPQLEWAPPAKGARTATSPENILNQTMRSAAKMALQTAPPRYPELKKHLNLVLVEERSLHVDVSLVDDPAIHELNRDFRHKNKPTDVLSFPQWEGEVFAFPFVDEMEAEEEALEITLGDMVISIDTAARQAGELRHSIQQEMAFLTIHGVLHLLGYDHQTDSQRKTMWRWQEEIFEKWKEAVKG